MKLTTSLPLFDANGQPTWLPDACLTCRMPVSTVRPVSGEEPDQGVRLVVVEPCGHAMGMPDPVEVTLA